MVNIDWAHYWHDHMGGWHILGYHCLILVEGGSMGANSVLVGYKLRCDWDRKKLANRNCPNIFRTFNGRKIQEKINAERKRYLT